ncbi:LacI family DNA-binding transcriptional regulator [Nonomuraea sp. NPDC026600]|uniref:LacI family DNA-binding transcriptional regulator n=1 Tax=Nonomuraea sp. NPDC026600 TaxID=3155363 RepID=UPI0033D60C2B
MTGSAKRVTRADVARVAGVSPTTVSFVLNDTPGQSIPPGTRRRVLEAVERLDYRPHASARTLAAGRSNVVLLSIPHLSPGPGITRFVEEFASALAQTGLTLITHLAGVPGRSLPDVCAAVDASVVVGIEPFDPGTVQALRRAGADIVLPAEGEAGTYSPMRHAGRLQAEHLIEHGRRRLGYALPEDDRLRKMAEERLAGVEDACAAASLPAPAVLVVETELDGAASAVRGWIEESVTGVCAYNDETAFAVLAGMRENGRTAPADLAVIGMDDIPLARLTDPPLTTVRFDLREAGRHLAQAVAVSLSSGEPHLTTAAGFPRVIRRSTV